jgi:pSer/pThr/pTyr-binding forkhead associated (FHA) protein
VPLTVLVRNPAGGGDPPPLTFDGDRIVLGRGAFADVRLPDPSVSSRHATVRANGGEYLLLDEGSTNGTYVGGVRLAVQTPRALRSGDLVRLGRVWIEVRTEAAPITHDLQAATREVALQLVANAMDEIGERTFPIVTVVEGPDRGAVFELPEEGHVYVVGRGEGCAVRLTDPDASRDHVQLLRRGGAVLVQDLGAKNRCVLGEAPLPTDRPVVWKRPAMLRVGSSVLSLAEPVLEALADLEASADEPLPEVGAPPPPPPSSHGLPVAAALTEGAGAAPLVAEPAPVPAPTRGASIGWSSTDIAVGGAAALVIALSATGLYWLLKN